MKNIFLSNHQLELLSSEEKKSYFISLKEFCVDTKRKTKKYYGQDLIFKLYPLLRNYDLEIIGEENIPVDDSAIFLCNHSNSHDFFTANEVFKKLGRDLSVFAASDCLSPFSKALFNSADATMIERQDKKSATIGTLDFSRKIIEGKCGVIFGEATWNLHPYFPMQPIKIGGIKVGAITDKVVIPTIFEYIEIPELLCKEKDLYSKCVVCFGKPIKIDQSISLVSQTIKIQKIMEEMRRSLWSKLGIKKSSLKDINPTLYENHTYLKKYKAIGFTYNSEYESQFTFKENIPYENEYHIDEEGNFVPGIVPKKIKR